MYESFFALKEKPFALTPNPRFLFLSKTHNEVYAHLIYGIESRAGFVEVTGEVGTGKTTILRTLLSHLDDDKYRVAFIFNPKLTAFELLRNINQEFGVADDGDSSPDLINALNGFLLAENQAGRTPILVIDEAQNLSGEVLEQIRLLSNLETEDDKLIQVVLVGQPELRQQLNDYSLRQLNQRIAVRYQLRPLNDAETGSYILHRLKIAGRPDNSVFSKAALKKVFKLSGGVPRCINLICDRALLTAFTNERAIVTAKDVLQAAKELNGLGEELPASRRVVFATLAVAAAVVISVLTGAFLYQQSESLPLEAATPEPAKREQVIVKQEPVEKAPPVPDSPPIGPDSVLTSCNALLTAWEAPPLDMADSTGGLDLDSVFTSRGFKVATLAGSFDEIMKYNVPVLLPVKNDSGGSYLAVIGESAPGLWSVSPAYAGKDQLTVEELDRLSLQMAILPWMDFASIGYVAVPNTQGENVRRLQFLLGLAGCKDVPTDGRYGRRTMDCVKQFQRDRGVVVDGLVGPRTLMLLYQVAGVYKMPKLS